MGPGEEENMVAAPVSNIWNDIMHLNPTQVNHGFHWSRDAGWTGFQPLASDRAVGSFMHNQVFAD